MAEEVHGDDLHSLGYYLLVDLGGILNIPFQNVIQLDGFGSIIEFREFPVATIKQPGFKNQPFILLNGVFVNNKSFFDWYDYCKTNSVKRQAVVIKLFDESGLPIMTWKFPDAYAVAISSPVLLPNGIDIALERISFNFGNMILSNGS
jgi:phage tail-like protein